MFPSSPMGILELEYGSYNYDRIVRLVVHNIISSVCLIQTGLFTGRRDKARPLLSDVKRFFKSVFNRYQLVHK